MTNLAFDLVLAGREKEAWEDFNEVIYGFLGNKLDDNYTQLITTFLQKCRHLSKNVKIHFLHSDLDSLLPNFGAIRTNMAKGSIKTFSGRNGDIRVAKMK